MPDRLSELQRQRALLQEHLAWLEREISREAGTRPVTRAGSADITRAGPAAPAPASAQVTPQPAPIVAAEAPQETAGAMAADARRGCLIAFAVGMVLFFALVLGAYYLTRGGE
jgi:hypothetical protein